MKPALAVLSALLAVAALLLGLDSVRATDPLPQAIRPSQSRSAPLSGCTARVSETVSPVSLRLCETAEVTGKCPAAQPHPGFEYDPTRTARERLVAPRKVVDVQPPILCHGLQGPRVPRQGEVEDLPAATGAPKRYEWAYGR